MVELERLRMRRAKNRRTQFAILAVLLLLSLLALFGQEYKELGSHGEYYFRFHLADRSRLEQLTREISIDNFRNDTVFAYGVESQVEQLRQQGFQPEVLLHPGKRIIASMSDAKAAMEWDSYPTYEAYVEMMNGFASDYPELCQIVDAGYSVRGRSILFAKISDNVEIEETEPEFMYTATMHGNETIGYILMLRLIDYLLTNYGSDAQVTRLVDSVEIWINPLANPDGAYRDGNASVLNATRNNTNQVDLNRNFPDPDPQYGDHPDGKAWQPETIAMMSLAEEHNFVASVNFHDGVEVVNYPWDTWSWLHPDNDWFWKISRAYADMVHQYCDYGYMNYKENGITNGYAWYPVKGSRQDYMTYFRHGREVTIELSDIKGAYSSFDPADLPTFWEWNYRSMLNQIGIVLHGIRGMVTDVRGLPLEAKVTLLDHDFDHSEVFSDPDHGDYYRLVAPGTYDVKMESEGYIPVVFRNIVVKEDCATMLDAQLCQAGDVDRDGELTIYDVVKTINFLLEHTVPTAADSLAADWDQDGQITLQDVNGLVEQILDEK